MIKDWSRTEEPEEINLLRSIGKGVLVIIIVTVLSLALGIIVDCEADISSVFFGVLR